MYLEHFTYFDYMGHCQSNTYWLIMHRTEPFNYWITFKWAFVVWLKKFLVTWSKRCYLKHYHSVVSPFANTFQIPNFFTSSESKAFVRAAESIGFIHQGSLGPAKGEAYRDNDRISVTDQGLAESIWQLGLKRIFDDIKLQGKVAIGLNPNIRFYRLWPNLFLCFFYLYIILCCWFYIHSTLKEIKWSFSNLSKGLLDVWTATFCLKEKMSFMSKKKKVARGIRQKAYCSSLTKKRRIH